MSEIDDIFARLGGGRITPSDQRDHRDIPRRGKAGGSRTVEVVHLPTRRAGASSAPPPRPEAGARSRSWDAGLQVKAPQPTLLSMPAEAAKAPEQVGHLISRWEPAAQPMPSSTAAPDTGHAEPLQARESKPRAEGNRTSARARPIADPFDPDDDRTNCLRCGYAVEPGRDARGLATCAACAADNRIP